MLQQQNTSHAPSMPFANASWCDGSLWNCSSVLGFAGALFKGCLHNRFVSRVLCSGFPVGVAEGSVGPIAITPTLGQHSEGLVGRARERALD